jgi:hypothetical protein
MVAWLHNFEPRARGNIMVRSTHIAEQNCSCHDNLEEEKEGRERQTDRQRQRDREREGLRF